MDEKTFSNAVPMILRQQYGHDYNLEDQKRVLLFSYDSYRELYIAESSN